MLVEIERTAQEMAGGIGNEKLGGRGRVAFDEVDQPENIVPAEKFFIDRLCLDGVYRPAGGNPVYNFAGKCPP